MEFQKVLRLLILVPILLLTACGTATPAPVTPTTTTVLEPTPTSPPAATATPAAETTPEATADPNKVITGGAVVIGIPREPDVLSQIMADEPMERLIGWFMVEGLVQLDAKGNPFPVLAETLPVVSDDNLTLTYTLKKGVLFSNGEPFTCADVQFTWKAIMSYQVPYSKSGYEHITTVDCPDETTAVIRLDEGYARYLELFNLIIPKSAGNIDTITKWDYHSAPVGTGPWVIWEWQVGDHILLARNPYYREPGKPYLENIVLKFLKGKNSIDLLVNGEIDIAWGLDDNYLPALTGLAESGIAYRAAQSGEIEMLRFNLADPKVDAPPDASANPHPILGDNRVRQAIQLGIDKQAIVDLQLSNEIKVSDSVLPAGLVACDLPPVEYNPERARALLEEAGWKVGSDGIREKDGVRLSLKITAEAENSQRAKAEDVLVQNMKAIGVELLVDNRPFQELNASWRAGGIYKHGAFDMLLVSGGGEIFPGSALRREFHSARIPSAYNNGEGKNFSRYHNAEVDAWIDQAIATTQDEQQQELYCKVAGQINRDLPVVPLFEHLIISAYRSQLQNLAVSPGPANFTVGSQNWWLRP